MDQAAACLTICRINQLLSPSLLLKWWKADPSMSLTSPVLQTVTRDQIKAAALKNEIEQLIQSSSVYLLLIVSKALTPSLFLQSNILSGLKAFMIPPPYCLQKVI